MGVGACGVYQQALIFFLSVRWGRVEGKRDRTIVFYRRLSFSFPLLVYLAFRARYSRFVTPGPTCTKYKRAFHIERFNSRDQRPYWLTETKENVCIKIDFNSRRIGLVHQYGRRFFNLF